jgi:protein-tyrosine phosphatase
MPKNRVSVLMVCLGNICRSPLAEGVLRARAIERGLEKQLMIDSAGTADYHVGELPDWRAREVALKHGFELTHLGRQFVRGDFKKFQTIFVMDQDNHQNVMKLAPTSEDRAKVRMLAKLDPALRFGSTVKDPYYDGIEAFYTLYEQLVICLDVFLDEVFSPVK